MTFEEKENILKISGFSIVCESPLEICFDETGDVSCGVAASYLMDFIIKEHENNYYLKRIQEWSIENSGVSHCVFTRRLIEMDLQPSTIVHILELIDNTCNYCWSTDTFKDMCSCMMDE